MIMFWINEPSILLNKEYIFELWPVPDMCMERKMNAITRLIILLTILGFIVTMSTRIIFVGVITLVAMVILYKTKKQYFLNEGFSNIQETHLNPKSNDVCKEKIINPETLKSFMRSEFKEGTKKNPFSNVLLTEITDDPERKSAPPSFNPDIDEDIMKSTKKMVQSLNPDIKNTNKQLFSSLTDNFYLDQSMRVFNSTPNTKIPNDQEAFGNFLYGNMPSAKESTPEGNMQRYADSYRYTLY